MESKGAALLKRKNTLLDERKSLLDIMKSYIALPTTADDQDVDISVIRDLWTTWINNHKGDIKILENKLADRYHHHHQRHHYCDHYNYHFYR